MFTPPPDSTYIQNELIIKFKASSLNLNLLCFDYPETDTTDSTKSAIMAQRFYVDDLIADSALLEGIKSFGGDTLKRITSANPCSDTISISRYGDTLKIEDHLWMTLHIDNDTNVINGKALLDSLYLNSIDMCDPNYISKYLDQIPTDDDYSKQKSIQADYIHIEKAWDFTTSSTDIKIGIVDNGIYWQHEDFGFPCIGISSICKIAGGWNYTENSWDFSNHSSHGTPVAGIIGALANDHFNHGIAGIAGGWGWNICNWTGNLGSHLYGYRVSISQDLNDYAKLDYSIAAIREASAYRRYSNLNRKYGDGVHILNNSYGGPEYAESERAAINYVYENGVSFVAARGNNGDYGYQASIRAEYPACYEDEWVTNVGASRDDKLTIHYSSYNSLWIF